MKKSILCLFGLHDWSDIYYTSRFVKVPKKGNGKGYAPHSKSRFAQVITYYKTCRCCGKTRVLRHQEGHKN